ncbi:MAG: SPW repeat domain-containing protein [Nitrospiraceae bacterium]
MWAQAFNTALGVWLVVSPALLNYTGPGATNHYIVGPIIASIAFVSLWQVLRPIRWMNAPLGAWLLISPWLLNIGGPAMWTSALTGFLVMICASRGEAVTQHFGGGWSVLLRENEPF